MLPGIYFCTSPPEIRMEQGLVIPSFTDHAERRWRLLTSQSLGWVAEQVAAAIGRLDVADQAVSDAIEFFYRLRECWETEGASEGLVSEIW